MFVYIIINTVVIVLVVWIGTTSSSRRCFSWFVFGVSCVEAILHAGCQVVTERWGHLQRGSDIVHRLSVPSPGRGSQNVREVAGWGREAQNERRTETLWPALSTCPSLITHLGWLRCTNDCLLQIVNQIDGWFWQQAASHAYGNYSDLESAG